MQLIYCDEVSVLSSIIPQHIDAFIQPRQEHKIPIMVEIRGLAKASIPEQPFPLPQHHKVCDLASTSSTALVQWLIQNFLAQTIAPACVVLHRHAEGSQPATAHRLGHSSNTSDVTSSTI